MYRFSALVLLLLSLRGNFLPAQPRYERSVVISRENGLPSNIIYDICKDPGGFVWIATGDGLCRYDGSQLKIYRNDRNDSTSLFDNTVQCVAAYQGKIWAGTSMGLSVLDPETETFTHFQFENFKTLRRVQRRANRVVTRLFADPWGDLWIGTLDCGAIRYRRRQGDFQFFPAQNRASTSMFSAVNEAERILSLAASAQNDSLVYAGTASGLQEINRHTGIVKWYVFPQATQQLGVAANAFRRLYYHDDGLVYAGSWFAGVHVFDPLKKTYSPLPLKPGTPGEQILKGGIRGILRQSAETVWISTGLGMVLYHTGRHEVVYWKENDLLYDRYYAVYMLDDAQRAWFYETFGVGILDPNLQQFVPHEYGHLRPLRGWSYTHFIRRGPSNDKLVVLPVNDNGIYHFNLTTRTFERFPLKVPGLKTPDAWKVSDFVQAPDGSYTMVSDAGIFRYHAETHTLRPLNLKLPVAPFDVRTIHWDDRGRLWLLCARKGMYRVDPRSGAFKHYQREFLAAGEEDHPMIHYMARDSRGQSWIRREGGFSVYLPDRDTILNFVHAQNPENSLEIAYSYGEDRKGRMWITGNDSWLGYAEVAHPERGIVKKFNLRQMLDVGEVYNPMMDRNGRLWAYNNKNLVCIQTDDRDSIHFQKLSLDYGEGDANYFTFMGASNGEMVLGGRNRVVTFDPDAIGRNPEIPGPYITEIQVLGKALKIIPSEAGQPVLRLRHWENFFSVAFSAKAFTLGHKCRFRYRLKGLEEWHEPSNRRFANYTSVPGGDYVFQLQAANNEGVWNDAVLEMAVHVDTVWWATWWFRGLLLVSAVSIGYGIYRYRVLQIHRRERLRAEFEKRLANVEMSALLAQMNPHFLFNCLNSIDSYIIRNESKKASEYLNNFARLIRLILQHSRTNYTSLKDELETLDLYLQMESLRFKDKFEYEISVSEKLDTESVNIPPMLIQPYVENAIWHGLMHKDGGGGKVRIRVDFSDDHLVCTVEDNGVGRARAADLKPRRPGHNRGSMGMKITEDRIEIINKLYGANTRVQVIDLYDAAGTGCGTRVVLTIPI